MRRRTMEQPAPAEIYLGVGEFDASLPYGDGPWYTATTYKRKHYSPVYWYQKICNDELHSGPPWKDGGPLDIVEVTTDQFACKGDHILSGWKYRYCGSFLPFYRPASYLFSSAKSAEDLESSDFGDISAYGAVGWNKFRPTNSSMDLGQALVEIKDVPRMLKSTAKSFAQVWRSMGGRRSSFGPKSVANEWLNTQFGWIPFLSDVRDFHRTTSNLDRKLQQLRKDNGQWIRRGGSVSSIVENSVVEEADSGLYPALYTYIYNANPDGHFGKTRVVRSSYQRTWFKGAFRYWIPKYRNFKWDARGYAHLYGMMPSPSLVWELTPWSWLVDWCSNVGDVIANISSIGLDALCAKYAYIMGTTGVSVCSTETGFFQDGPITYSWSADAIRKRREEASPFGFGLTGANFSARQWSILGALGLTRLR